MRRASFLACLLVVAAGCASMSVQTDYSPEADFGAFETFQYRESSQRAEISPLVDQRIVAAIRNEMTAAGLSETDDAPDLYVTYYASIDEQLQFQTVYTGVGGWGRRGRVSMGMSGATTRATTFEEGSLVIDIWQADGEQLVWRGVIQDSLSSNVERNREMVNRGIARAFEAFPPG